MSYSRDCSRASGFVYSEYVVAIFNRAKGQDRRWDECMGMSCLAALPTRSISPLWEKTTYRVIGLPGAPGGQRAAPRVDRGRPDACRRPGAKGEVLVVNAALETPWAEHARKIDRLAILDPPCGRYALTREAWNRWAGKLHRRDGLGRQEAPDTRKPSLIVRWTMT